VTTSTIALAMIGECVRSSTADTLSGRMRSNDHANRLRVAIRNVAGSATMKATMNDRLISAIRNFDVVSIDTKKKKNDGEPNGYSLAPLLDRKVAEPRKSLPNVRLASAIRIATSTAEMASEASIARVPRLRAERTSPPAYVVTIA
jgi:hypothetical protein